jgi:hypothetical protein
MFLLSGCELDNYSLPDKILEGVVIDIGTGEPIQTRQPNGIKVRLLEEGYDNPVPYDFWAKADGSFKNTRIFAAQYKAVVTEGPFEQSSADTVLVNLSQNQTVTFEVEPFVRLADVAIIKSGGGIQATYKISTNNTRKVLKSMLIVYTSPILHQTTTGKLSSAENDLAGIDNPAIDAMSFQDEIQNLESGKTYYARVAVLAENSLNRFNYSPIIEINL